jgi:hypothetical protein
MSQTEEEPERAADAMERRSSELQGEIEGVSRDWEAKRSDPKVPGANPPPDEGAEDGSSESVDAPPEEAEPGKAAAPPEHGFGPPAQD